MDLLIRRIEGTLGRGSLEGEPITADEIRDARFRTKLGGYHELAVDFALEAFIVAVETRPAGVDGRPLVPPSRPAIPSHRPSVPWPTAPQALEWERAQPAYWDQRSGEPEPEGAVAWSQDAGWDQRSGELRPEQSEAVAVAWQPQVAEGELDAGVVEPEPGPEGAVAWSQDAGWDQRSGELRPEESEAVAVAWQPQVTERDQRSGEPVVWQPQVAEGDRWSDEPAAGVAEPEPGLKEPVAEWGAGPDAGEPASPAVIDIEEQAVRVERAAFRAGRLGMGYNEDQVDLFLDRIVATLRGTTDQPLTPGDVRGARFATVMLRPGYAVAEVDGFLADLADVLEVVSRQRVPQE